MAYVFKRQEQQLDNEELAACIEWDVKLLNDDLENDEVITIGNGVLQMLDSVEFA